MARSKAKKSSGYTPSPSSIHTSTSASQFSLQGSQKSTPPTSDEGEQEKTKAPRRVTRTSLSNSTRKRALNAGSEDLDENDTEPGYKREDIVKRRAITNTAYVEITQNSNNKLDHLGPGKKVRELSVSLGTSP